MADDSSITGLLPSWQQGDEEALEAQTPPVYDELQYFAGFTFDEMATATGLSTSTTDRELRFARAWLADCRTRG